MLVLKVGPQKIIEGDEFAAFRDREIRLETCDPDTMGAFINLYDYDLLLIGTGDALTLVRIARRLKEHISIVVLGSRFQASPRMVAEMLDAGACDFIPTPCEPVELFARVRVAARRGSRQKTAVFRHGVLTLNLTGRRLSLGGVDIFLSRREFSIMEVFAYRNESITGKHTFLDHVYGSSDEVGQVKVLDVMICRLRKKFRRAGFDRIIRTEWGIGYALYSPRDQTPFTEIPDAAD